MRDECPRPDMIHSSGYLSLNGPWEFAFGEECPGFPGGELHRTIEVPFAPECDLSGIGDRKGFHDYFLYRKDIDVALKEGYVHRLTFMGVDFSAEVYVNGRKAYEHTGGAVAFSFLLDPYLKNGRNEIALRAYDPPREKDVPRGKQYWKEESEIIWYTRTSGIYRSVYLETLPADHVVFLSANGSFLKKSVDLRIEKTKGDLPLELSVCGDNGEIYAETLQIEDEYGDKTLDLRDLPLKPWTPETPNLYRLRVRYGEDEVETRLGFRDVAAEDGKVLLNGRPYFQKLALDQGYYPGGNLTAPAKEDFLRDIILAKQMGFNGVRVHQKTPDPWFLHYADEVGFLVWCESPSCFEYSKRGFRALEEQWPAIVRECFGHPSVVAYTPNNESWGIDGISKNREELDAAERLYRKIKQIDPTRLVVSNDGWENPVTDLVGIHDYSDPTPEKYLPFLQRLSSKENMVVNPPNADRPIFAPGRADLAKPFLLTEYGGISYNADKSDKTWGYGKQEDQAGFIERYRKTQEAVASSPYLAGYCYTQLYDVEQEINGLLTFERKPKAPLETLRKINEMVSK